MFGRNPIAKVVTRIAPKVIGSKKVYSRKGRRCPSGDLVI